MAKDLSLNWDLESLNKAYQQGYLAGLMGMPSDRCPYRGDVITASWEAGWEDGRQSNQQKPARDKIA